MLPTKYLLSDHWEFMGIRKTKTNFAENLKSVAQEIGIRDVSVCSPVCRSVALSWLIPDPSVDLKFMSISKSRMSEGVMYGETIYSFTLMGQRSMRVVK